jgi:4a-hydroxytetrahydrobiopterin dehydratase
MLSREPLSAEEISQRLPALPSWSFDQDALVRTYRIDYDTAAQIIVGVARICHELDHHADIDLRYGMLRFASSTHDRDQSVTAWDFALAEQIERLLGDYPET